MNKYEALLHTNIAQIYQMHPYFKDFFYSMTLKPPVQSENQTMKSWFEGLDLYELEQKGIDIAELPVDFVLFMENMEERHNRKTLDIDSITILGGQDKEGISENIDLTLKKGDVVSIVGPTGSGKSRLLGDIEWLAQGDTPTGRTILINGEIPPKEWRFSIEHKLVAQLSQNMNFVMDLKVGEFIKVHMESRMVTEGCEEKKQLIIQEANRLAGEPLYENTPITSLSGGQSRALMIADTAYLSSSPIVLIDEIENAGIDKKIAVDLLIKAEKIVLIATHDPVLALRADRRIVIKNGGIRQLIKTTQAEKEKLRELEELNNTLLHYRELLKSGQTIQ